MMRCKECGRIFDEFDYFCCPDCLNSEDIEPYSENDDKYEKFKAQLNYNIHQNDYDNDTDHPLCPDCGSTMNFYGHDNNGDYAYGEGYWECDGCGYKVTENEL